MILVVFCLIYKLQIQNISIGFRGMRDSVNFGICKYEIWFTCRDYCKFTLLWMNANLGRIHEIVILNIWLFIWIILLFYLIIWL